MTGLWLTWALWEQSHLQCLFPIQKFFRSQGERTGTLIQSCGTSDPWASLRRCWWSLVLKGLSSSTSLKLINIEPSGLIGANITRSGPNIPWALFDGIPPSPIWLGKNLRFPWSGSRACDFSSKQTHSRGNRAFLLTCPSNLAGHSMAANYMLLEQSGWWSHCSPNPIYFNNSFGRTVNLDANHVSCGQFPKGAAVRRDYREGSSLEPQLAVHYLFPPREKLLQETPAMHFKDDLLCSLQNLSLRDIFSPSPWTWVGLYDS